MNTEFFIAKRIFFDKNNKKSLSQLIIKISVISVAMGLVMMILSLAIVAGFKTEVRNKVIGFGAHIIITNHNSNSSIEMRPINKNQKFYPDIKKREGIKHIQVFATKGGILKTEDDLQGVIIKGIGSDFNWEFFDKSIIKGKSFRVKDNKKTNEILISKYLSNILKLDVGEKVAAYFIQENQPPRLRRFTISGIYETSMEEIDRQYILADIGHIRKLNNWDKNQIGGFEILIDDYEELDKRTEEVFKIAGAPFQDDGSKLKVRNIRTVMPQIFEWLNISDYNFWIILILLILVAAFNMTSGLMILILERTKMIGILKSLGYPNVSIRKIFLYNAAFLTLKGILWGNIIGLCLCYLQKKYGLIELDPASYYVETVPIVMNYWHLLFLNLGVTAMILFILILPSAVISRIKPVKAIRFN